MQTDRRGAAAGDDEVRLSWSGGAASAPSAGPTAPVKAGAKATKGAAKGRAAKVTHASTAAPAATPASEPAGALEEVPLGRVFVGAFDRLSDRLLDRLRALRADMEGDLSALRAEMTALREAVDAMGDRVQVRQLRATLDELQAEVVGLRRAVLEWPELEQLSQDVTAVRGDLAFLFDTAGEGGAGQAPSELLGELQAVVARLAGESSRLAEVTPGAATDDGPLLEEVAALRAELAEVRRRVARPAPLDGDQLEWLVGAVADRVAANLRDRGRRLAD
jgi:hypothetical protein